MRVRGLPYPVMGMGSPLSLARAKGVGGDPVLAAFADGTDGFYFDFSKTDRLFQNLTGSEVASAGDNIYLGLEGHSWGGRTLASELTALTNIITNGNNESALFTSAYGAVGATSGTVAQSADFAYGGEKSAKFLCNTASSVPHYIVVGFVPENTAIYIRGKVYVPTGSLATFRAVDTNDGSWILSITAVKDQWVSFVATRAAKATAWNLAFGNNDGESLNTKAFYIDDLEIYAVPGNHGLQATTSLQPKWQTGGLARFDGLDDILSTPLTPSNTGMTFLAKAKLAAAGGNRGVMGVNGADGVSRCFLAFDASGFAAGGVGSDSLSVIKGSVNRAGSYCVLGLTIDSTTWQLYEQGVQTNSGVKNGSCNTTLGIPVGSLNANGTYGTFLNADVTHALAIKKALTAAQIAAITNKWGTS